MLTDAVKVSVKAIHRGAMDAACKLTDAAKASRIYQMPAELDAKTADDLAEMLTTLVGVNNTLLACMDQAEIAADTTRASVRTLRRASFPQLVGIWRRLRANAKAMTP